MYNVGEYLIFMIRNEKCVEGGRKLWQHRVREIWGSSTISSLCYENRKQQR